ncbi:ammonium transporter [Veillonella caviae]|uniref:ammonium transporter n=1 Tax=Veillonella caviae TaxID=248316 RepID=UPI0023F3FFA4|nr:ammonium transporter [Veillonella caviae]MDD7291545.1 ammonium transporter [Veillonella caviae]MDY5787863.1 ammonium transporter [Veillonella caviae]MDY6225718.1 ammonium transporter [Veillonella caviae]
MIGIDTGNTAWVLLCATLVFFMTPGLALFYGGMARSKNVLGTIMQSFFLIGIISVEFILIGYTMIFGNDIGGMIGGLDKLGLVGTAQEVLDATNIPEMAFVAFQCMFAVLTPAIISGSVTGRMRFAPFVVFSVLWAILIYNPMAHWVWGGGFLAELGALDFAGGLVIHVLSGVSGLTLCILLGRRRGYGRMPMLPHHLPMTILGASILWFGWFGFNAGSALGVGDLAANAMLTTQIAAAIGIVGWVIAERLHRGKPTVLGAASGAIAGLVAITPAAGFVTPLASIPIGLIGAISCYVAVAILKNKFGYDDSLDAFGIHGVGGTWGAIATGLWATTMVNPDGADGLFYGGGLLTPQCISLVVAIVFAVVGTFIIFKVISIVMDMRVTISAESLGIDISEHGEGAYNQSEFKSSGRFITSDQNSLV